MRTCNKSANYENTLQASYPLTTRRSISTLPSYHFSKEYQDILSRKTLTPQEVLSESVTNRLNLSVHRTVVFLISQQMSDTTLYEACENVLTFE